MTIILRQTMPINISYNNEQVGLFQPRPGNTTSYTQCFNNSIPHKYITQTQIKIKEQSLA